VPSGHALRDYSPTEAERRRPAKTAPLGPTPPPAYPCVKPSASQEWVKTAAFRPVPHWSVLGIDSESRRAALRSEPHDSAAQMSVAVPLVDTSVKTPLMSTVNTTRPT
jgi:hypothetical protein